MVIAFVVRWIFTTLSPLAEVPGSNPRHKYEKISSDCFPISPSLLTAGHSRVRIEWHSCDNKRNYKFTFVSCIKQTILCFHIFIKHNHQMDTCGKKNIHVLQLHFPINSVSIISNTPRFTTQKIYFAIINSEPLHLKCKDTSMASVCVNNVCHYEETQILTYEHFIICNSHSREVWKASKTYLYGAIYLEVSLYKSKFQGNSKMCQELDIQ